MPINDWMPTLVANMEAVAGIEQAHQYDDLPATIQVFPSMLILPIGGDQEYSVGGPNVAYHVVNMTLYVTSQVLPEAYGKAVPFIELVRNALAADIQLGGNCTHCLPVTAPAPFYEGPGSIDYGDKQHLGIIFHIIIKENESGDYPVTA